jgi:hypothetical protein
MTYAIYRVNDADRRLAARIDAENGIDAIQCCGVSIDWTSEWLEAVPAEEPPFGEVVRERTQDAIALEMPDPWGATADAAQRLVGGTTDRRRVGASGLTIRVSD